MKKFKATFFEGLVFFIPAVLTTWLCYRIFTLIHYYLSAVSDHLPGEHPQIPHFGLLIKVGMILGAFLFIVLAGILAETVIGRFFRRKISFLVHSIPLVNSLYDVMRQIIDILFRKSDQLLSRPVLVPFPHQGKQSIGFVTGEAEVPLRVDPNREYLKIFVPTVPIPTTGFYMIYPRDQVRESGLRTEEALRLILSGGLLDNSTGGKFAAAPETSPPQGKVLPRGEP